MKSYFFNAEPTTDLEAHPTGFDRTYDADDQAEFFAPFFTAAGVFAGTNADACKVSVERQGAEVVLRVAAGAVYAKGRMAIFDGTETVSTATDCKVVARMDKTADVRAFRLLAVTELVQTEDVYDVALADVVLTPVMGGFNAVATDRRSFMAFTGQPPYYPPDSEGLPYILWLYTIGFPMTAEQKAAVEGNPGLMEIYGDSIAASCRDAVLLSDKATAAEAKEGVDDSAWMTPLRTKESIDKNAGFVTDAANMTKKYNVWSPIPFGNIIVPEFSLGDPAMIGVSPNGRVLAYGPVSNHSLLNMIFLVRNSTGALERVFK